MYENMKYRSNQLNARPWFIWSCVASFIISDGVKSSDACQWRFGSDTSYSHIELPQTELTNVTARRRSLAHQQTARPAPRTCQTTNMCRWHGTSSDSATCWTEWRHIVRHALSDTEQLLVVRWGVLPLSSGCSSPRSSEDRDCTFPPKRPHLPTSRLHATPNPTSEPKNLISPNSWRLSGFRNTLATKMFHNS
jgi:hypothetical protein